MVESTMNKLQALATLVGLSDEFDSEIAKLEELKLHLESILKFRQRCLSKIAKDDPILACSKDPDATFFAKYQKSLEEIQLLEESIEIVKEFTEGTLKYG